MALAGFRGYLPNFSSPSTSSSALASQKPNYGVDSAKPLSGGPGFKFNSPAVTVGNPGGLSSSYTQTGPQQTAEKVMKFENDTGLKLNDIK
jgi:hypothetical protein